MKTPRTVTLEFTPGAFALLEATAAHDGYDTPEEFIRGCVAGTVLSWCEAMASHKAAAEHMRERFDAPKAEEGGRA